LVFAPKYVDSLPAEPTPVAATWVTAFMFKTFWRFITSVLVIPCFKFVANVYAHVPVVVPPVVPVGVPPVREAWTFAMVCESAPNDVSKETIASTWLCVKAAASATEAVPIIMKAVDNPTRPATNFENLE